MKIEEKVEGMFMARNLSNAGGCFWGLENIFSVEGVEETTVGYANGQVESTNYQLIHQTDHAETVQLIYNRRKHQPARNFALLFPSH